VRDTAWEVYGFTICVCRAEPFFGVGMGMVWCGVVVGFGGIVKGGANLGIFVRACLYGMLLNINVSK
jgi:hypothetical protein